jgi:hypothetical protein
MNGKEEISKYDIFHYLCNIGRRKENTFPAM